jgi:HPt (histidine-containing phosphotransfer) domain-containing protein
MLLGFRDNYEHAATELNALIAEGRNEDAERLAHSLKGIAATLEARELAEAASSIEQALREGRTAGLGSLIDAAEKKLSLAIAAASLLDSTLPHD